MKQMGCASLVVFVSIDLRIMLQQPCPREFGNASGILDRLIPVGAMESLPRFEAYLLSTGCSLKARLIVRKNGSDGETVSRIMWDSLTGGGCEPWWRC